MVCTVPYCTVLYGTGVMVNELRWLGHGLLARRPKGDWQDFSRLTKALGGLELYGDCCESVNDFSSIQMCCYSVACCIAELG